MLWTWFIFNFNFNSNGLLIAHVILISVGKSIQLSTWIICSSSFTLSEPLFRKLNPSFHRDLEVHYSQEWIDTIFFLDNSVNNIVIFKVLLALVLLFKRHQVDFKLCLELKDLHLFVNFHVSVFSAHASI